MAIFQLLILGWETETSVLKNKNTYNLGVGNRSVLWHSMKILENFVRCITNIDVL